LNNKNDNSFLGTTTIVVVDNYPDNLLEMRQVLRKAYKHIEIVMFERSVVVMEYIKNEDVSVVILDVQMPVLNGLDLCRMIKSDASTEHISVILVTSYEASSKFKAICLNAGADDLLIRPIDNDELVARVNVALRTRKTEQALESQAVKVMQDYEMLFNKMISGFAVMEMFFHEDGKPIDCRFLNVNPAFEQLTNLKAEDVIGKLSDEIFPGLPAKWVEKFNNVVKAGKSENFEYYSSSIDKFFEISAFKSSENTFAILLFDITKRCIAQKEQGKLKSAIEQLAESILITDAQGTIEYTNPAFTKITGYSGEYAIGRNPSFLDSELHDKDYYGEIFKTVNAGETWKGRFNNRRKDGSTYISEAHISPILDNKGSVINLVAVEQDVTERTAREELWHQSQKMESIGQLAGGVAHDFNNLLMAIIGYVDLCRDELEEDHPASELLDEVTKAAERSVVITRQLQAFARKQSISPEVINLNESISATLNLLRRMIGEDVELKWIPSEQTWVVKMDPRQIDQILANLFVNARDAIDGVGQVIIETYCLYVDAEFAAKESYDIKQGQYIVIAISDNGCGMDHATQENVFEPFFTTKDIGKGTGLGLSTVYGIVKQNNGFVNVYSEKDHGTTFRIYLPRFVSKEDEQEQDVEFVLEGNETILLVEDEQNIRAITSLILEGLGYNVLVAADPTEAIQKSNEYKGKIDILLSDVVLPIMNGLDLATELEKTRPEMKQLFMSGYTANVIDQKDLYDKEINFLSKPFSRETLAKKIRQLLDK